MDLSVDWQAFCVFLLFAMQATFLLLDPLRIMVLLLLYSLLAILLNLVFSWNCSFVYHPWRSCLPIWRLGFPVGLHIAGWTIIPGQLTRINVIAAHIVDGIKWDQCAAGVSVPALVGRWAARVSLCIF